MTLAELNAHFDLLTERAKAQEIRSSILDKARPGSPPLTGMPRGTDVSDKVGNLAIELAELDDEIAEIDSKIAASAIRIEPFIKSIRNIQTRMIFRLRFLRGLSWGEVADALGKYVSEVSVKQICYNYLRVHEHDVTCR